jgi:hypothetical protein
MTADPRYFLIKGVKDVVLDEEITDGYNHCIKATAIGELYVTFPDDSIDSWTISILPTYIWGNFKKVNTTGTTIAAASLKRYKLGSGSK